MAENEAHTKVRVLLISDTHNANPEALGKRAFRDPLPKADILIHSGDLTNRGRLPEYEITLELLSRFDAELKLVIAGNHDLSLDRDYKDYVPLGPNAQDEKDAAAALWKGHHAMDAGVTYLEEGMHTFTLQSGARFNVYASPYTPQFFHWAFSYEHNEDRWNPQDKCSADAVCISENPIPDFPHVDLMITHGPPQHHLGQTTRGPDAGCPHLFRALQRVRPRLQCFGHIHEAWGAELIDWTKGGLSNEHATCIEIYREDAVREKAAAIDISSSGKSPIVHGQGTLLVNASIMHRPIARYNPPWLNDMDLPVPPTTRP